MHLYIEIRAFQSIRHNCHSFFPNKMGIFFEARDSTPPKTKECPLKSDYFKRTLKSFSQQGFYVCFPGRNPSRLPYIVHCLIPPKWVPFNDPCLMIFHEILIGKKRPDRKRMAFKIIPSLKWVVLLLEEILHHLVRMKPINNGINYLSTGAGFLPSTVVSV